MSRNHHRRRRHARVMMRCSRCGCLIKSAHGWNVGPDDRVTTVYCRGCVVGLLPDIRPMMEALAQLEVAR